MVLFGYDGMKAVKTIDLAKAQKTDPFSEAVAKEVGEAAQIVRKTFSLERRHLGQINAVAAGLSQKAGKPIGASKALRYLLDQIDEKVRS